MPRRLRKDHPGAWHHVWNRGIAKRTLFETRRDVRYFLACLARQARCGAIEVHAYSVLTTHFHLLVRSPGGGLSAAMQRVQDAYARWFNIGRRRDGPLFRGRFGNRIIDSESYWWSVLGYIDRNPVEAGLCAFPLEYPHGSARHYGRSRGPGWLTRVEVERACGKSDGARWDPGKYAAFAAERLSAGQRWLVERRRELPPDERGPDPLDELLGAAPERVRRWMEGKALAADGTVPGHVLVSPGTVVAILEGRRSGDPGRTLQTCGRDFPYWDTLEAAARREFCGQRLREISEATGKSVGTAQIRLRAHARALKEDAGYLADASAVLAEALEQDHGQTGTGHGNGAAGNRGSGAILGMRPRGSVDAG